MREPELLRLLFGPHGAGSGEPRFEEGPGSRFSALIESLVAMRAGAEVVPDVLIAGFGAGRGRGGPA